MLFNSFVFLVFLAIVLVVYWALRDFRLQNAFLLVASLAFYAWGEPILVSLILVCAITGYLVGLGIEARPDAAKWYVAIGSLVVLGILFVFKYFNFFVDSMASLFAQIGLPFQATTLRLILPIGISFFTFQTVGYMVDVYRGRIEAEHNAVQFLLFVTFFPQLVAGPIERATNLLPQIKRKRSVDGEDVLYGVFMILQGYVKKIVIADNLGPIVDTLFGFDNLSAPLVIVGTLAFAFQIYGDFSGYTDIARGVARLMGFHILLNFNHPYVSKNPTEFWRRWHITLSLWFRDYVYIPLGGNRRGSSRVYLNVFITMVLSGLWHGASANFVVWGAFWGAMVLVHKGWLTWRANLPGPWRLSTPLAWASTFAVTLYGWLLFRVEDWSLIVSYTRALFVDWSLSSVAVVLLGQVSVFVFLAIIIDMFESRFVKIRSSRLSAPGWALSPYFAVLFTIIVVFGSETGGAFIYFRF